MINSKSRHLFEVKFRGCKKMSSLFRPLEEVEEEEHAAAKKDLLVQTPQTRTGERERERTTKTE